MTDRQFRECEKIEQDRDYIPKNMGSYFELIGWRNKYKSKVH